MVLVTVNLHGVFRLNRFREESAEYPMWSTGSCKFGAKFK